ncbi:MAG: hypothetical protein WCP12_16995 [bacterium]
MKQKKTLRFSDSDSSASALKVPESKQSSQIVTVSDSNTLESQQKRESTMNTDTNTTTDTTATAPKAKAKRTKKTDATPKAHTIATCTACANEYKAEAWHTESLCPTCYAKAHPKPPKAESTTAQTVAKVASAIMLAVLITKGTHYAVSVIDPSTGANVSKVYLLKSHTEALTLAEKMYHDRKLDDILDASPEATDTEATIAGE